MVRDKKITKKKKESKKREEIGRWHDGLKEETKHSIWAIVCLGVALFFILSIFGKAGMVGTYVDKGLDFLFGGAVFLVPVLFIFVAISFLSSFRPNLFASNLIGCVLVLISGLALAEAFFGNNSGGYIGFLIALPFLKLVDFWVTVVLFLVILLVGFLVLFNLPLSFGFLRRKSKQQKLFDDGDYTEEGANKSQKEPDYKIEDGSQYADDDIDEKDEAKKDVSKTNNKGVETKEGGFMKNFFGKAGKMPPIDLLLADKGKPTAGDIKANSNIIKRTFQNFGISIEIAEVCIGPSVTQYAIKPAEGVKLSKIISLNNDLALALAAHPIRIEAPIPGKSLVGIEVPNRSSSIVGLRYLLKEAKKTEKDKPLIVSLGRNVAGKAVFSSIAKMPHLLVAGATGSGKSVCVHSLLMSLLYRHSPLDLQLLLVDPKRVEMNIYNDLPHLLTPVVTEAKKAIMALKWATKEMERRYEVLLAAGTRDIHSYRKKKPNDNMPFIVIVIDELADIMSLYPRELEASIVRLAQMSRAVGIHLVVSTQRPSVDVITGLIKANIPTRIAFQVASQIDSRTILDMAGAEKLLGNGDMLYLSTDSAKPRRIQGSFVSEEEVQRVVDYLKNEYEDFDSNEINVGGEMQQVTMFEENTEDDPDGDHDDLYEEARALVIEVQKASSSYLQRRLRVGYARAARLLDMLEERGVVGPPDGSKPREVFVEKPTDEY